MVYTPQEVARLLANRINQPHYIEWLVRAAIRQALKQERAFDSLVQTTKCPGCGLTFLPNVPVDVAEPEGKAGT